VNKEKILFTVSKRQSQEILMLAYQRPITGLVREAGEQVLNITAAAVASSDGLNRRAHRILAF
jgi:hypothetical protein